MEEVCGRENLLRALRRVKSNKGSPGIDGMTVADLPGYLKQHWPAIRGQLLSGSCKPQAVRWVEIPKPEGGVRKLGIPTVLALERTSSFGEYFFWSGAGNPKSCVGDWQRSLPCLYSVV